MCQHKINSGWYLVPGFLCYYYFFSGQISNIVLRVLNVYGLLSIKKETIKLNNVPLLDVRINLRNAPLPMLARRHIRKHLIKVSDF